MGAETLSKTEAPETAYFKQIIALAHLYLEDSYVLGIKIERDIAFDMLLVLTPEHPEYHEPKADEQYCYRRGKIIFRNCELLEFTSSGARPVVDSTGEPDFGNIDSFLVRRGVCQLNGEWGKLMVRAKEIVVEFEK